MAAGGSKIVIYAAIGGNFAIAVTKFIAAYLTGSSAMLSEGVHSLVDTGNGLLLLWGIRQSSHPPDERHPFGRGKELYFWTLIVAILIFAVGGGISIYEGIIHVQNPSPAGNPMLNYIVLGLAMVFEGAAWYVAFREFSKQKLDSIGYLEAVRTSKDPATFTVLFEDTAAMIGLVTALLGVFLGHALEMPVLDGVASIVIGLTLSGVAVFLAYESKSLLVGEGVDRETRASIRQVAESDPDIRRLVRTLSMHMGPHDVLLTMETEFRPGLTAAETARVIDRLDKEIRGRHPEIKHIFVEAQSIASKKDAT